MANIYTKLSFVVPASQEQADLFQECLEAASKAAENYEGWYDERSDNFKQMFNNEEEFTDLFDDPGFPNFGVNSDFNGSKLYIFGNENANPYAIGQALRHVVPDAMPFGFEWSSDCDKPNPGEFGGGFVLVTTDDVVTKNTYDMMEEALHTLKNVQQSDPDDAPNL